MKSFLLLMFLTVTFFGAMAQECSSYAVLMQQGDQLFAIKDYQKAVDKYTAALLDCPENAALARVKIIAVFTEINTLKEKAVLAEQKAKDEKERADKLVKGLMPPEAKDNEFEYFWNKGKNAYAQFKYEEAHNAILLAINVDVPPNKKDSVDNFYLQVEKDKRLYNLATGYFYKNEHEKAKPFFDQIYERHHDDTLSLFYSKACFNEDNYQTDPDMIKVEGGQFTMGDTVYNRKYIEHQVKLTTFYMSKYEVTNAQYARFLNQYTTEHKDKPEYLDSIENNFIYLKGIENAEMKCGIYKDGNIYKVIFGYENRPAAYISWYGANAYCEFYGGSLPTEAQWEYAAKGGSKPYEVSKTSQGFTPYKYSGSDNVDTVAWYSNNSGSKTHSVGTKMPNQLGIYDMSGNLWEWCLDWYSSDYYQTCQNEGVVTNPSTAYMQNADRRILRGGGWDYDDEGCRTVFRGSYSPAGRDDDCCFRFLRNP